MLINNVYSLPNQIFQAKNNAKEEKPTQEETTENVKKKNKQYYTVNKPNVAEGATERKTKEHNRNSSSISPSTDIYNYYKLSNCTGDKEYNYYDTSNRAANNKYFIEILEDLKK